MGGAGEGGAGEGAALPLLPAPRGIRHAFLPRNAVGPEARHAQHPALRPNLVASLTESHLFYIQALQKLNFFNLSQISFFYEQDSRFTFAHRIYKKEKAHGAYSFLSLNTLPFLKVVQIRSHAKCCVIIRYCMLEKQI